MQFGFDKQQTSISGGYATASDLVENLSLLVQDLRSIAARGVDEQQGRLPYVVTCSDPTASSPLLNAVSDRRLCLREHLVPLARLAEFIPPNGDPYCNVLVLVLGSGVDLSTADNQLQLLALCIPRGGFLVVVPEEGLDFAQSLQSVITRPGMGFERVSGKAFATFRRIDRDARDYYRRSIYRQPRVAILNDHLQTFGGGERSTLQFARAFEELGFAVDIVAAHKTGASLEDLSGVFNIKPLVNWRLREFSSNDELDFALKNEGYEIFLNHSFGSMIPSPVPLGFYMVMFPHWIAPTEWPAISSYRRVIANSAFTAVHVRERWNRELSAVVMIPPPHPVSARTTFEGKEPLILNVGRFNVRGHNKHQLEAIKSFCALQAEGTVAAAWKLMVVGNVNDSADNRAYLEQCRNEASRGNVEIVENAPFEQLEGLYQRASVLWQFTGCDLDWGKTPEQCEHLGLVALDCFAYGVIPIIYQRSGMSYLLRHGIDGYVFADDSELKQIMSEVVRTFKSEPHRAMFEQCRTMTKHHDTAVFRDHLERVIVSASSEVRDGSSLGW